MSTRLCKFLLGDLIEEGQIPKHPYDAEQLADKMSQVWKTTEPGPDLNLERRARRDLPVRMQHFADSFLAVAREAVSLVRGESG